MNILVVDDDEVVRILCDRWLHEHDVEFSSGYEEAKIRIRKTSFDLFLCDHRLPPLKDGEVADRLRTEHRDIPLIEISAASEHGVEKQKEEIRKAVSAIDLDHDRKVSQEVRDTVGSIRDLRKKLESKE